MAKDTPQKLDAEQAIVADASDIQPMPPDAPPEGTIVEKATPIDLAFDDKTDAGMISPPFCVENKA